MATKHDKTALTDALASLAESHPELAERLGADPSRADLLAVVEDIAPAVAGGARSMSRASLVALLAITPKEEEPEPEPLTEFTTRLPQSLADAVRARSFTRGCSIQALMAEYVRAGLAADADEPSE